jgi:hypothetical protein
MHVLQKVNAIMVLVYVKKVGKVTIAQKKHVKIIAIKTGIALMKIIVFVKTLSMENIAN